MQFSLIIPVYNTKKYLKKCLESIEEQDFQDYEVILIDDGSNDGSELICDEFCKNKVNYRVIHKSNKGVAEARNTGIKEAKGEWIWFIDSDDYIVPGALSSLFERMHFAKGDMYVFQYYKTDDIGENIEAIYFREYQSIYFLNREEYYLSNILDRLLKYKDSWEVWARLYRREIITENQLWFKDRSLVFAEDLCFTIEYMLCCKNEVMLVNYLYYYRQNDTSFSNTLDEKSILPSLFNLLEDCYLTTKRFKKKYILKHFDILCYELICTHLKKFRTLSDAEVKTEILKGANSKIIGRYVKKVIKKLLKEIDDRKVE